MKIINGKIKKRLLIDEHSKKNKDEIRKINIKKVLDAKERGKIPYLIDVIEKNNIIYLNNSILCSNDFKIDFFEMLIDIAQNFSDEKLETLTQNKKVKTLSNLYKKYENNQITKQECEKQLNNLFEKKTLFFLIPNIPRKDEKNSRITFHLKKFIQDEENELDEKDIGDIKNRLYQLEPGDCITFLTEPTQIASVYRLLKTPEIGYDQNVKAYFLTIETLRELFFTQDKNETIYCDFLFGLDFSELTQINSFLTPVIERIVQYVNNKLKIPARKIPILEYNKQLVGWDIDIPEHRLLQQVEKNIFQSNDINRNLAINKQQNSNNILNKDNSILVVVHGFNQSDDDALELAATISLNLQNTNTILFRWDSGVVKSTNEIIQDILNQDIIVQSKLEKEELIKHLRSASLFLSKISGNLINILLPFWTKGVIQLLKFYEQYYQIAEGNYSDASKELFQLVQDLEKQGKTVSIIAHSMGCRVTANMLHDHNTNIKKIVFAAPDIGVIQSKCSTNDPFLLGKNELKSKNIALYASSMDFALIVSELLHGNSRLGQSKVYALDFNKEPHPKRAAYWYAVDASKVNTTTIGHSYLSEVGSVLSDVSSFIDGTHLPSKHISVSSVWDHYCIDGEYHFAKRLINFVKNNWKTIIFFLTAIAVLGI